MTELQPLSALAAGSPPGRAIEEVTVKGRTPDEERFGFLDFLDIINPLQHIPIVNTFYREITGDEIKAPAKMIGSALIGGPVGLAVAMADSIVEDTTGKDVGGHAMAFLRGEDAQAPGPATAMAQAIAASPEQTKNASRELIPAALMATAASSDVDIDVTPEEDDSAPPPPEQTEAVIAAAAAAAPPGLVFMPLPGRQPSKGLAVTETASAERAFIPIKQTDRAGAATPATQSSPPVQATAAYVQSVMAAAPGFGAQSDNPLLDATQPSGDTGKMPQLDPFATARRLAPEPSAITVPAWFDKAMMDATGQTPSSQTANRYGNSF